MKGALRKQMETSVADQVFAKTAEIRLEMAKKKTHDEKLDVFAEEAGREYLLDMQQKMTEIKKAMKIRQAEIMEAKKLKQQEHEERIKQRENRSRQNTRAATPQAEPSDDPNAQPAQDDALLAS